MRKEIKELLKLKKKNDEEATASIKEIDELKNLYIEKISEQSAKDRRSIENMAAAMSAAIDDGDFAAVKDKINSMLAILDQDNDAKIKQEILDSKLRSANVQD